MTDSGFKKMLIIVHELLLKLTTRKFATHRFIFDVEYTVKITIKSFETPSNLYKFNRKTEKLYKYQCTLSVYPCGLFR